MTSVMNTTSDGGVKFPPPDRGSYDGVAGDHNEGLTSGFGESNTVVDSASVSVDGSGEPRVMENFNIRVSKQHNEKNASGGGENRRVQENISVGSDYNSILSAFDDFAAKAKSETVGHGFYIGDMVWGKVKSHPWWPGHIYNEALASQSVQRNKHDGQILVAFFGDSSYGWFDPADLIPFEENFADKSKQTMARPFVKAVEEAVDEVSRRSSLGVVCCCRNELNFRPSGVENYFLVDLGDIESGVYGWSQINKAQDGFQPREMIFFMEQLATRPRNDHLWTIDFIKNKATVLACRKALFEEFDETYAQAFGAAQVFPPRPSAPVTVDPSKAPLSGRKVIAESLVPGKISVNPTKTKDLMEKDKYLFKRRDEPIPVKSKKVSLGQAGPSPHLQSSIRDRMQQAKLPGTTEGLHQSTVHRTLASTDIKPSEGFKKHEGGIKKTKVQKRPAGELNAENAIFVEKKKKKKRKELSAGSDGNIRQISPAVGYSGVGIENVAGLRVHVPVIDSKVDGQMKGVRGGSFSSQMHQETDFGKIELQMLVRDLGALALNPFHGFERSCPDVIQQVFLKFRSLVYQKSLALSPPRAENTPNEGHSSRLPAATVLAGPADKTIKKMVKPLVRLDDPTRGGKKRLLPSDRPEDIKKKKKKLDMPEEIRKMKKVDDSGDAKKRVEDTKLFPTAKKILQMPIISQHAETKENVKIAPVPLKLVKLESSKRTKQTARVANRTMLVMKFPSGAALPSGAELRAKFARFGPLDHSATRIFWQTYTCRLVYLHRADAQVALRFASGSAYLFGNSNVRCYLRAMEVEAAEPEPEPEPEPSKPQKEEASLATTSQPKDFVNEQRAFIPKIVAMPIQSPHSVQQQQHLKSILKKPSGDEGGNGNGRGARVKFIISGDETMKKSEVLLKDSRNRSYRFHEANASLHTPESNKILPKFVPHGNNSSNTLPSISHLKSNIASPPPPQQVPSTRPFNAPPVASPGTPVNDISSQMLNLLTRCNDVVNNLMRVLGYVPYHPL